jgi:hypothetical protein
MADTVIHEGRPVAAIPSAYGFASIEVGPPLRPEPARVEVRTIDKKQLLRKLLWTEDDFQAAQQFDFPTAGKRTRFCNWGIDLIWREDAIDRWIAVQRDKAAEILRLVGNKK